MFKKVLLILIIFNFQLSIFNLANAQVGEYRNKFAVGVSGGYVMNTVSFVPDVPQTMHTGTTFGIVGRYTSEKYFSTICSVQMEVNFAQLGWKQKIETIDGDPVINPETQEEEAYSRDISYIQIPVFAHLAWGKERHGVNFFINAGPQFGLMLSNTIVKNYEKPFIWNNFPSEYTASVGRVNSEIAQENLEIKNEFDYGIAAGAGVEWDIKYIGRFALEGRYYFGLGNLFGDAKKDDFSKSPNQTIYVKLSYLRDL